MLHGFKTDSVNYFVDYADNGKWILGCVAEGDSVTMENATVLDTDTDINKIVRRAVFSWDIPVYELWLSPCATEVAVLMSYGLQI